MSVTHQIKLQIQGQKYKSLQKQLKQSINLQISQCLSAFHQIFLQTKSQIQTFLTNNNHPQKQNTIIDLNKQIIKLKEDNSNIRNEYMLCYIDCQQLKNKKEELIQQHIQQTSTIKYFASELQSLKASFNHHQIGQNNHQFIDFDSEQDINTKLQGLEVIKEVSQHDLSCSMSLQSYNSQMSQNQNNKKIEERNNQQFQLFSNDSSNMESRIKPIESYLDALDFLKNYNTESSDKFMKKVSTAAIETSCRSVDISLEELSVLIDKEQFKENITINNELQKKEGRDSIYSQRKVGRDTINRIKKMRIIQQLQIQNTSTKQNQQTKHKVPFPLQNQANKLRGKHIPSTYHNENLSLQNIDVIDNKDKQIQTKKSSARSVNSNKFGSRIKQDLLSLDQYIVKVFQILKYINSFIKVQGKVISRKELFVKIEYNDGFTYAGNSNQYQKPSGYGKLLLKNQITYQGQWRNGLFQGWGKLILLPFISEKDKEKQIIEVDGYFKEGLIEGAVICIFSNGQKFMGTIKDGQIRQQGTLVSQKQIYTGHWENNRLQYRI